MVIETDINLSKRMTTLTSDKIKAMILGVAGIAVAAVTKIKEMAVSLVSQAFSSRTQKEGVHYGQASSRLGGIGLLKSRKARPPPLAAEACSPRR